MRLPSGLNATLVTWSVWPVSGCADRLAGGGVPHPHRLVPAAGGDALAVGAERHAGHPVGVAGERRADRLAGGRVPQPHRLVDAAGGEPLAVGAERHAGHRVGVALQRRADRAGRWRRPTPAPSCRQLPETMRLPSGLNATLATAPVWPVSGGPIGWPVVGVPHPHRLVAAAGDDPLAVGAERHAGHSAGVARERLSRSAGRWPRPTPAPSCPILPEAIRLPSGLNATLNTASVWPVERLAERLAGGGVPHPHRLVLTAGDDALAVGAERHADHLVGVAGRAAGRSAGRWPRPTPAPSCRSCRRRCACRRG